MPDVVLVSSDLFVWPQIKSVAEELGLVSAIVFNTRAFGDLFGGAGEGTSPADVNHVVDAGSPPLPHAADVAARLVIIDLSTPGIDIESIVTNIRRHSPQAVVVAFGPHVHEAKLRSATEAGCDRVLSRGQFSAQIDSILKDYVRLPGARPSGK